MALFLRPAIWHASSSSGAAQDRAHRVAVTAEARDRVQCALHVRTDRGRPNGTYTTRSRKLSHERTAGDKNYLLLAAWALLRLRHHW